MEGEREREREMDCREHWRSVANLIVTSLQQKPKTSRGCGRGGLTIRTTLTPRHSAHKSASISIHKKPCSLSVSFGRSHGKRRVTSSSFLASQVEDPPTATQVSRPETRCYLGYRYPCTRHGRLVCLPLVGLGRPGPSPHQFARPDAPGPWRIVRARRSCRMCDLCRASLLPLLRSL